MFAGPVDGILGADLEQELELLGEERVVVFELEAEEGEGLDEGSAASDNLGASIGNEVEGGELLEDADRVSGGEDGDGGVEADAFGARGGGGQDNGGGGVKELGAMVLADTEGIEADLIGEDDLLDEVLEPLGGRGDGGGDGIGGESGEAIYTKLHGSDLYGC